MKRLEGTAFFINDEGVFLTAGHVVRAVKAQSGLTWGLNVKGFRASDNLFAAVSEIDFAPSPFDIAIGKVHYRSKNWFTPFLDEGVGGWHDVATLGYPASALNTTPERFNNHLRLLKGYIQREIAADELPVHRPHPNCFELSFPIPNGLSGSPLFSAKGKNQQLIGVCVGSFDVEIVIDDFTHVDDDGKKFSERRVRVEQYGIAHSILPLWKWRPSFLQGKSLAEAIAPPASV